MSDRLTAAVIGLGHQAKEDHLPGLGESTLVDLVAVCDIDAERCADVAEQYGVPAYLDHIQLLDTVKPQMVIITLPHHLHFDVVTDAINRGCHVLKEKPFALSVKEATELGELASAARVHVMTTLQRRFNPIYTSFFQLVDQIGKPFLVNTNYTMYVPDPHVGWRGSRATAGGGCLIDMGYHMLDLLVWYVGMPSSVVATISATAIDDEDYDAEDTAILLLSWPGGIHGTCRVSRSLPPKTEVLRVVGTRGVVEVERGAIRRLASDGTVKEELLRDRAWGVAATSQIDHFARVIRGERTNPGSPEYHRQHAAIIEAAYESAAHSTIVDPRKALT